MVQHVGLSRPSTCSVKTALDELRVRWMSDAPRTFIGGNCRSVFLQNEVLRRRALFAVIPPRVLAVVTFRGLSPGLIGPHLDTFVREKKRDQDQNGVFRFHIPLIITSKRSVEKVGDFHDITYRGERGRVA